MSTTVTIAGGTAPEVTIGDAGASVSVPSVSGVLSLNSLSGAVTLAVVGGTIAAAGNTLTITVTGGSGASSWTDLTGKPFTTLGTGLSVSGAGVLSATGLAIADTTGLQAALDLKAPLASPTFTGTVSGVTKAMVGLSAVDNVADASKPVSTAQVAANAAVQAYAIQRSNHTGTQAVGTITGLGGAATLSVGTTAGTVAAGNDARFSDARTPTSHVHGNITNAGAIGTAFGKILTTEAGGVIVASAVGAGIVIADNSIGADLPYIRTQLATVAATGAYADLSGAPAAYSLPTATASVLGGVKIGSGLSIDGSGVVTAAGTYTLPAATTSVLGGVIVGTGLSVTSGTISVSYGTSGTTACVGNDARLSDARTPTAHTQAFSTITATPTTLSGYGITDAATSTHVHGNITNAGAIGSTSGQIVVTTTSGVLTTAATIAASAVTGLATVATSGAYTDLSGKPTIPTITSGTAAPSGGSSGDIYLRYSA